MMKMTEYYDKKTLNNAIDQLIEECKLAHLHSDSIFALSRFKLILNTAIESADVAERSKGEI